jgi:hypothetical protein
MEYVANGLRQGRMTAIAVASLVSLGACGSDQGGYPGAVRCGDSSLWPGSLEVDRNNCGACGVVCAGDDACDEGTCAADRNWALWPMPSMPIARDNYTTSENVVVDNATGLTWQRRPSARRLTWREVQESPSPYRAYSYCQNLNLDGTGWRLPTRVELLSVLDYTRAAPAIETEAFPDTPREPFLVAEWQIERPGLLVPLAWDFSIGKVVAVDAEGQSNANSVPDAWVRCVRSPTPRGGLGEHYHVDGDTVLDNQTHLRWQATSPTLASGGVGKGFSQASAAAYCAALQIGSLSAWRLPSITELQTLFRPNPRAHETSLDPVAFAVDAASAQRSYWSSTAYAGASSVAFAWVATLEASPYIWQTDIESGFRVRCVRGSEP